MLGVSGKAARNEGGSQSLSFSQFICIISLYRLLRVALRKGGQFGTSLDKEQGSIAITL